tara:strand:- start:891 stop:1400 length:510 start_codon:yes stop_codon:yes gene_type:complete
MKNKTQLPIFTGFYNTIFDIDFMFENIEDIESIDYKKYENDISIQLCEIIKNELSNFIKDIEFIKVDSPKYYNYSNDSIDCIITPKKQAILSYIKQNYNNWCKYLKDNYTSYDGFISHYSNNPNSKDWTKNLFNEHQISGVLDFIAKNEDITTETLYYELEVYSEDYRL